MSKPTTPPESTWQPTKIDRPSVRYMLFIRPLYRYDLCWWGMCREAYNLIYLIDYFGGKKMKDAHWACICKLKRLQSPWAANKNNYEQTNHTARRLDLENKSHGAKV